MSALTTLAAFQLAVAQGYERAAEPEFRAGRLIEGVDEPVDTVVLAA